MSALGPMLSQAGQPDLLVSEYLVGDTATRSTHLRLGAKRYPTLAVCRNGEVTWRDDGVVTFDDGEIDLSDLRIALNASELESAS